MIIEIPSHIKFRNPREIISEHRLLKAGFRYVLGNNQAQMAPYHNTWHLMCMVKYVDWIMRSEKDAGYAWQEDELDELAVLLAAMFHDVNHTMGRETDDVNVANSKRAFSEFLNIVDEDDIREEWLKTRVHKLIDATQFPYVIPVSELSYDQKIMRDADFMQAYEDAWFYHIIIGIGTELKKPVLSELKRNILFHKDVTMNTAAGKMFREAALPVLVSEFEGYIKLLE